MVVDNESGQSLLEFLLMLPLMAGLVFFLFKVNTAIQISIVNQQYSRAQALWLTHNNATYPSMRFTRTNSFTEDGWNQMIIGVSSNNPGGENNYEPDAMVFKISRGANVQGNDDAQSEPDRRGNVRVRSNVALCTQNNTIELDGGYRILNSPNFPEQVTRFSYCRSEYDEQ